MLTESEKKWLKDRKPKAYCRYCGIKYFCSNSNVSCFKCPLIMENLEDALEFSERVAAKLADPYYPPMDAGSDGPQLFMPPADRLKWARIEVEEEMDADR